MDSAWRGSLVIYEDGYETLRFPCTHNNPMGIKELLVSPNGRAIAHVTVAGIKEFYGTTEMDFLVWDAILGAEKLLTIFYIDCLLAEIKKRGWREDNAV